MSLFARLTRTRVARGTAMGVYTLAVQIAIQLLSVPVLTTAWGVAGYGAWVLLFTVPALLGMADFGLTTAGANTMTEAAARGERKRAARIYSALRLFAALAALTILGLALGLVGLLDLYDLDAEAAWPMGETRLAAMLLCAYGALSLTNGITLAGFRAADAFAFSGMWFASILLAEALIGLGVALSGGGPAAVALAFLTGRILGSILFALSLRRCAPWLGEAGWLAGGPELRELVRPGLAALVFPAANAVSLQGAVVAIGAIAGPAAIPAYAVVRTLSRTALQFAYRFNVAAMPRYTVAVAHGDAGQADRLVAANLAVAALLVIPAALLLVLLGGPFIELWTLARIEPGVALLGVMALTMVANAAWAPLGNLLLAINRHESFTYVFLVASTVAVGLGGWLVGRWGALGMALAMLALEMVMVARVWIIARRDGLARLEMLAGGFRLLREELLPDATGAKKPHS